MPKINVKLFAAVVAALILAVTLTGISQNQNAILSANKDELAKKLENTTHELEALKKNYTDLMDIFVGNLKGELNPQIQTRLGVKIMPGQRYPNYLWVTGEVENVGNFTLYNVRLRYTLYPTNSTDVKEDIIGTMHAHQIVTRRYTAYTSLGEITSWTLDPVATYEP